MNILTNLDEELLGGFGDVVDRLVSTPSGTVPLIRKGRDGIAKSRYSWMKVYDKTRTRYGRPLTLLARVSHGTAQAVTVDEYEGDHKRVQIKNAALPYFSSSRSDDLAVCNPSVLTITHGECPGYDYVHYTTGEPSRLLVCR